MIVSDNIKQQSAEQVISSALDYCRREGYSIAIWKHPEESSIELMVDFSSDIQPVDNPLEQNVEGFLLSPFDKKAPAYLIKANLHIKWEDFSIRKQPGLEISNKADELLQHISKPQKATSNNSEKIKVIASDEERSKFINLSNAAIAAIKNGQFLKVVPSRKKEILLPEGFDLGLNFIKLSKAYPTAFASLIFTPKTGIWMGATPELLINEKDNTFRTVALAGTQKYDPELPLAHVAWRQKEIEEQALVARYIINCFKKIRLRDYTDIGPKTVIAGNLLHLKTEFIVDMEATGFPGLGDTMLKLLHPTSAICGMPLAPAQEFIKENEYYDRSYYSGYIGPVNSENGSSLFVNLRCMSIDADKATLYAGAGVTEDSIPEDEWEETEIKMNTILNIIG
ncbi:chorismate-binding protein [Fulvivirga maritima]|uniref:chorismate-binding protein n=1 Tax=Fulvivirga maritima TaxID=2904247 RepID=UPI001F252AF3|nr:chorismate-binding protein [Fulvivirga maritima]UII24916.1 chorismate-binding protein [Fulvivirga maritima]